MQVETVKTRTSATHAESAARPRGGEAPIRWVRGGVGGFTLVELIVALAIVGVMLAVVPVALDRAGESLGYRSTVQGLVASIRGARNRAASSGRPAAFFVVPERRTYGIEGGKPERAPDFLRIKATTAAAVDGEAGVQRIVFMPDGSSSGGSVEVTRASGQGVRLRVDWLLGRITHEAPGT